MNKVHSSFEFTNSFLDQHSKKKKVLILTVDGGFDSRYSTTINCVIEYFAKQNLDDFMEPPTHMNGLHSIKWKDLWLI